MRSKRLLVAGEQNPSGTGVAMSNRIKVVKQISRNLALRKPSGPERSGRRLLAGFSLIELMVAMSIFMIVGGAAISLVRRHMPLFNTAQNQTTLNITLRNAVAQFQMEVVNAGTGYAGAAPTAFSPMGVTITKAATPGCNATANYVAGCFDKFSMISVDSSLPLLVPSDATLTGPANTTQTTLFLTNPTPGSTAANYATWAALLPKGTELMFVQGGTDMPAGQASISIVVLQSNAVAGANFIQITTTGATQSLAGCVTTVGTTTTTVSVTGIPAVEDPLGIYDVGECGRFTGVFNPALDYVVKLVAGATYSVDASNPANPKLVRTTAAGTDIIAEQIIGFTVGAWSSRKTVGGVTTPGYTTNPSDYSSDWASVRSLQIQIVARTAPNSDNPSTFQNSYDQGSYQVQGVSVVVNPRNLNTN
jgi:prepilin-type N-terminal cleavage/methylation domain-containing protein